MSILQKTNKGSISPNLDFRDKIIDFESQVREMPDSVSGNNYLCPLKHSFADNVYIREMFHPKGLIVVGKIHKYAHAFFITKGELTIISEEGKQRIKAPHYFIAPSGAKRALYAHEDTTLITIHHNPHNITDINQLEEKLISENYDEYEKFRLSGNQDKNLLSTTDEINNCGLVALRKISNLKNISAKSLISISKDNGITLNAYNVPVEKLKSIPLPAIVHSENHFDYISKKSDFNDKVKYTGYVLLPTKINYPEVTKSELKNISGETFVSAAAFSAYAAGAALIGSGIGAASKETTECGKKCRAECKATTSALFGGRSKCKKACKAKCFSETNEPPPESPQMSTGTIIILVVIVLAIIGLVWWAVRSN